MLAGLSLLPCAALAADRCLASQLQGYLGTGRVTYKQALAAVFVEGFIFLFLTVSVLDLAGAGPPCTSWLPLLPGSLPDLAHAQLAQL